MLMILSYELVNEYT